MKHFLLKILFIIFISGSIEAPVLAQTSSFSSVQQYDDGGGAYEEGFEPGLFFIVLIGAAIVLVGVGAGIVIAAIAVLALAGLISVGILSASIFAGVYKKSFTKGFKLFVLLACTTAGTFGFAAIGWLAAWTFDWDYTTSILTGALSGLISGLVFGFVACYVLRLLLQHFKARYNNQIAV